MCRCEGLHVCGYHAERIRRGLAWARSFPEGSEAHWWAMASLEQKFGAHRVTLIANLDNVRENA